MEEQASEVRDHDTGEQGAGERPKLFSSMQGMIAGATGLILALGGLFTAYDRIFDKDETALAASSGAGEAGAAQAARPVAAAAVPAAPAEDAPLLYEGEDHARMEWIGDKWVLTSGVDRWVYVDEYSKYEGYVLAYDKASREYLRWPIKGGQSEEGIENAEGEVVWKDWIDLYPPEPTAAAQ